MKSNDFNNTLEQKAAVRQQLFNAIASGSDESFGQAFDNLVEFVGESVRAEANQKLEDMQQELDSRILESRGVHQLTSEERGYYGKLMDAMAATDPRQAVNGMEDALPRTVINAVFEDLRANHPLLSHINFHASAGVVELLVNTNGQNRAVWGQLDAKIVAEMLSGLKKIDATLLKLSAFLCVCKSMLDLGPEWIDRFVRETLYEALAAGLEYGIVAGNGKDEPIGMIRQVGDNVSVVGGVHPEKAAIKVSEFNAETVGTLVSLLSVTPSGHSRVVNDLILLCNPQDYYSKVMPATTLRAPDGTYRNDILPYPMTVIPTPALQQRGKAVIGTAKGYIAAAGTSKAGKIGYSDDYRYLDDERVYLIKAYANGMPVDNNCFQVLDISDLRPAIYRTETVTGPEPSTDANLASLRIGNMKLAEPWSPETITYTAKTTDATSTIAATPADVGADIVITVGKKTINNGDAVKWEQGSNTVTVKVTAADGAANKTYTVTVTKS